MVEHAEGIAEVLAVGRQAAGDHGDLAKLHVGLIGQGLAGDGQGTGGVDAVQPTHSGGHEAGPAAGALAHVEACGIGGQLIQREDGEVVGKHPLGFCRGHRLLIKALPLIARLATAWGSMVGLEVIAGIQKQHVGSRK